MKKRCKNRNDLALVLGYARQKSEAIFHTNTSQEKQHAAAAARLAGQ